MYTTTFDKLRIITQAPIKFEDTSMFIVGCSPEMVNLTFGDTKQLRVKSCGVWTHSLFGWVGPMTQSLKAFTNTLPKHTRVISTPQVSIWLLKNNHPYGTMAISATINKSGRCEVLNNIDNHEIVHLDRVATTYRHTGKVDTALKLLFNIDADINFLDDTPKAIEARKVLFDSFTLPFTEDPEKESQKYESLLAKSFDVSNKYFFRQLFAEGYHYAVQLEKLHGH